MTLHQLLRVLLARKWVVVAMVIVGILVAIAVNTFFSPKYRAATTVVVDYKSMDPVTGAMSPPPGYLATQIDIIQSHRVGLKVVRKLRLSDNPIAKQQFIQATGGRANIEDWLADLLINKLDVIPTRDSGVITIRYTSQEPEFAAIIADAFAKAYIETNLELRVDPARDTATWFDDQIKALRENLSNAQAKLSAYQRQKGFSATDERADVESSRLAELSAQLAAAQGAASDAIARVKQLDDFLARGANPANLPDLLSNPLLQTMKGGLSQSEARLEMISSQLGGNHPDVQKMRADITAQRQKLKDEIGNVSAGLKNGLRVADRRVDELRNAVATQKAKMLELNKGRDDMSVLIRDVESAQRALDAASSRFTMEHLQSRSSQANVMVLSAAVPPLYPRFPKTTLNLALGILAGGFLGLNLALLIEVLDRRVRSPEDVKDMFSVPVLCVLQRSGKLPAIRQIPWTRRRALPDPRVPSIT
jgi:chain length determinant protein EpsF